VVNWKIKLSDLLIRMMVIFRYTCLKNLD